MMELQRKMVESLEEEDMEQGIKHDEGKLQYSLLPPIALREVVKVLTHGAKKYSRDNWKHVPDSTNRYTDAAYRHIEAWRMGETVDEESSHHHLAHAICCLMFLIEED
jgi:hypothetical protein